MRSAVGRRRAGHKVRGYGFTVAEVSTVMQRLVAGGAVQAKGNAVMTVVVAFEAIAVFEILSKERCHQMQFHSNLLNLLTS